MKLLGDSSSSLLLSLLLAQLHLLASAFPAQPRRIQTDFDKLTNQTRHLLKLTQDLLKDPVFGTEVDHHRFKSLPAISSRVSDLSSLEFKPTLSQLYADLKSFEHHFEWLNRTRKQQHSSVPKLTDMISHIKSLIHSLQRQVQAHTLTSQQTICATVTRMAYPLFTKTVDICNINIKYNTRYHSKFWGSNSNSFKTLRSVFTETIYSYMEISSVHS
uniref:Interleukin 11a n=1 Tax=Cyprinus carpio carpio TaxID=630221 RepID=A0A9J8CD02_CYPCA